MLERELSRRAFLRLFAGGGALSGLPIAGATMWSESSGGILKEKPRLEGPLEIGNLQLSVLTMQHSKNDWLRYQDSVRELIDVSTVIIPEYFPPEYSGTNGNYFAKYARESYKDSNYLFDEVEAYCRNNKKEVWVVDPAYNASFMTLRGGTFLTESLGLIGAMNILVNAVESRQRVFTRRNFLERSKDFGLAIATFSTGLFTPPEILFLSSTRGIVGTFVELNLRYILTASLLKDLSVHVPPKTQGLLIYPNIHWKGIKEYVEDDEKRRSALSKIVWLKNVPGLNSLFQGRHYTIDGNDWLEEQRIEVQAA